MPTFQDLERAFVKAHEAGDKQAASALASEMRLHMGSAEVKKPEEEKPVQATEPSEKSSDLLRGFTNYLPQLQETYGGAKVLAGKAFGSEDLMKSGLESMAAAKTELAGRHKATDSFTSALDKGVGAVLTDWLPYQIGSGTANLLESLVVMAAGSTIGSAVAPGAGTVVGGVTGLVQKELVKRGVKELAEKVAKEQGEDAAKELFERETKVVVKDLAKKYAATAALGAQAGFHGAGETTSRAVEEAQRLGKEATDIEMERVLPSAIVHSVAEYFGDKIGLGAWKNVSEDVKKGILGFTGSLFKNIAVTGTKEAPVEMIQSAAERFGAKLSLTDAEAVKEYIDSAAAAYAMSTVPAAGGTVRGYAGAMAKDDARLAEEAFAKSQEEAAKIGQTAVVDPQGNVAPVSFNPIQPGSVGASTTAAPAATTTAAPAATSAISDDTIKAAYAANDVSTSKAQKALKPQLEAMGLTTAKDQKAFLTAKRDELGIPAYNNKDPVGSKKAKQQFITDLEKNNAKQLIDANPAGGQPSVTGAPSELGKPAGELATSVPGGVDTSGGVAKPANAPANVQPTSLKDLSDQQVLDIYEDFLGDPAEYKAAKAELISRGKYAPIRTAELEQVLKNPNIRSEDRANYEAELNKLKEGAPSVTETTEAVETKEKGQEQAAAPAIDPEVLRAAYTEQVKSYEGSGFEFPAWEELSEEERAALAEEVQATKGMLPSKGGQKVGFLSPAMASIIKSRIDKKIESGEIDLTKAPQPVIDLYEEERGDWGERNAVRTLAWNDLSTDEKSIYLNNIKRNTIEERNNALDILADYRDAKLEGVAPRGASFYETNRAAYNKELPAWIDLTADEREAFIKSIEPGLGAKTAKPKVSTEQMDAGFKAVVEKINKRLKEKATKETEKKTTAEKKASEERTRGQKEEGSEVEVGERLDKGVLTALADGDINGALAALQDAKGMRLTEFGGYRFEGLKLFENRYKAVSQALFRHLAKTLNKLTYTSNVVLESQEVSNPVIAQLKREGKLAAYDPKTDTFYFTNDGLDEQTLLHEIVHAATVKILYAYKTNPNSLTQEEREAAEHIDRIYEFAKKRLGDKPRYKNAFENVFEFVSYALTDPTFQGELATLQAPSLNKYTKPTPGLNLNNVWSQFTKALMAMYNLFKPKATRLQLRDELYPAASKEFYAVPLKSDRIKLQAPKLTKALRETQTNKKDNSSHPWDKWFPEKEIVEVSPTQLMSKQAGYENNVLLEFTEAFKNIMAEPEAGIDIEALPAKRPSKPAKPPIQAPAGGSTDFKEMLKAMPQYDSNPAKEILQMSRAKKGEAAVRIFQNDRAAIKNWENKLRFAGRLSAYATGFNNIYTQLTLSSGNAHYLYAQYVQNHSEAIRTGVAEYAKKRDLSINDAVNELGAFAIALHEPERRRTLYIRNVPLEQNLATLKDAKGNSVTPYEARNTILNYLDKHYLDESGAKYLRDQLEKIVNDPNNLSKEPSDKINLDINSNAYSVAGYEQDQINSIMKEYNKNKHDADVILKEIKELNKAVIELNEKANYLSKYAKNYFMFYGYENYVPFKGKNFNDDKADIFNVDSRKLGGELQDQVHTFEGRLTVPDNPILQVMADGAQAAMRAGRKDVTQAIYNAVKDKTLQGSVMKFGDKDYISFEDRANEDILTQLKGETKIFHYMPDGKIAVIQIDNEQQREAIRRTYKETNPLLDTITSVGNLLTGTLGQFHTRYNIAFAPVNFVRDVLTNAFMLGAELGPKEAFRYIGAVASGIATGGMKKTTNFARLYSQGKTSTIEALAAKDDYYRDLLDYVKKGGKVSYIAGIAPKGQYQEFFKGVGGNFILNGKEQIDKYFDMWIDTFELSARVASFRVTKASEIARLTKEDPTKSKKEIEEAAIVTATGHAKNLANFEQVGQLGKGLGAFFMFFRPSATGAVRAIDAIAPMLNVNVERVVVGIPEYARAANIREELSKKPSAATEKKLKEELAVMDKAVATFRENYSKAKTSARVMSVALVGMGIAAYAMSYMMADDDDLGRNKTATDDLSRWTRFARFPIPGTDIIVQIPWGFGLGGFAAMGAQMASLFNGNTRPLDTIANMAVIGMDSFLPLPVSRISPIEKPLPFLVDSMMPSVMRPIVEFTMNVDALGRKIYNDRTSRLGDAYTGGDNIPELYKNAAIWWLKTTGYDVSPNSLYFFANNYADGATRLVQNANNVRLWLSDKKDFNPKTDTMLLDSFFGTASNFDAREWSRVESDLEERSKYVKMLKNNHPVEYAEYMAKNPLDQMLTKMYDHDVNGRLKDLREQANKWRAMEGLTPRDRTALVKNIVLQQNIEKNRLINLYRAFGVEP